MTRKIMLFCMLVIGLGITSCKKEEPKKVELKEVDQKATLEGYVGNNGVTLNLELKGKNITGTYYYTRYGPGATLKLNGVLEDNGHMELHETNDEGQPTGHFNGVYGMTQGFNGEFVNFQGTKFQFQIKVLEVTDNVGDGKGRGFMSEFKG